MKYRVFAQDVGRSGYSGVRDVEIESLEDYVRDNTSPGRWLRILLPHARKDLWPDGHTGELPTATHAYLIVTGQR